MTKTMQFRLKAGSRLFVNGAVLRVDRKVAIEFLNDVTFLLENHVLQAEEATTPLKQLYFAIQLLMIEPDTREARLPLIEAAHARLVDAFSNEAVLEGLATAGDQVSTGNYYDALKTLRRLFPAEEMILNGHQPPVLPSLAAADTTGEASWK